MAGIKTIQGKAISLTDSNVIEWDKESHKYRLVFPVDASFDRSELAQEVLQGRLSINLTLTQLEELGKAIAMERHFLATCGQ